MDKISLIITAGGTGSRYGKTNKLLEKIDNKTVIEYCVEKFFGFDEIFEIVIAANISIIPKLQELFFANKQIRIIEGGDTRQASVFNALKNVKNPDYVLIHDGARPLVKTDSIKRLIDKMKEKNAAILAVKTVDTIKKIGENGEIVSTVNRENLRNVQTPQGFEYNVILNAHKKLEDKIFTDDSGMLEFLNTKVYVVEGNYSNIKITTKTDLEVMKILLSIKE